MIGIFYEFTSMVELHDNIPSPNSKKGIVLRNLLILGNDKYDLRLNQSNIYKNKCCTQTKKPTLKSRLFLCTGGETRTLTPCGTRS